MHLIHTNKRMFQLTAPPQERGCLLRAQEGNMRGQTEIRMPSVTQHTHRRGEVDTTFSTTTHFTAVSMNGSSTSAAQAGRLHSHRTYYSHVIEPETHGRARSARVGPRVSRSPGVRAAHHGTPHAGFVHPVCWSMGLDGGMACAHGGSLTFTLLPLPPSHKHELPQSSVCDVTRSVQEAGG